MPAFSHPVMPLFAAALLAVLGSCAPAKPLPAPERALYGWYDDAGPGQVAVTIQLAEQMAIITRGDRPIGWTYVATGRDGHATRPGRYAITEKILDKYSNHYGWTEDAQGRTVNPDAEASDPVPAGLRYVPAPMPYWMRLTSYGIGMHAGVIPRPGETASHGCIRLPHGFAPLLYQVVKEGTPVEIVR